jgi:hypothetical protein
MPQAGFTPIITYHSTTGAAVPNAATLSPGELAVNIADMKLYAENSSGTVTLLASADAAAGNFTTVDATNLEVTNIKAKDGTAAATIADSTGVVTVSTQLNVDNLRLDGNVLSSTNTNGNIELTPNGNGRVTTSALSATSPRVITAINDTNGNELFGVTATTSAVNEFTVANAATGNAPTLSATGGDTNIGMALTPKGTGGVIFPAGAVGTPAITTSGDTNTGIFFPAADTIAFTEGGAEAMRIDSSGNVGIGTTTPLGTAGNRTVLTVNGTSSAIVSLGVGGTRTGSYYADSTKVILGTNTSTFLAFDTNDTERARITSGGDLMVGVTSFTDSSGGVVIQNGSTDINIKTGCTATVARDHLGFYNPNGLVGFIRTTNSSTTYNTSSDYRLKENIVPVTGALAKVAALKPCTYTWKADGSAGQGFIAHELQEVCPDAVTGEKDATEIRQVEVSPAVPATYDDEGNELTPAVEAVYEEREVPKYQGVDTSFLVATLTAAIQELKAELDTVKAELAALKGQ